ncbi:MAG: fused MFS/spermidine synthase [Gammaproteobacteria bacterium]
MPIQTPHSMSAKTRESYLNFSFKSCLIISAILIFWLKPFFGKIILPQLGGSPSIWLDCLLFFEGALFFGCVYAFISTRFLSLSKQLILHFVLLTTALFLLPESINQFQLNNYQNPNYDILYYLTITIGFQSIILSGSVPLLQRWFGYTLHPFAKDPYYLFSVWNIGKLASLLTFAIILEPFFSGLEQFNYWSYIYIFMLITLACCVALVIHSQINIKFNKKQFTSNKKTIHLKIKINWSQRTYWMLLMFAPVALLFSVTNYITTEIANLPVFWFLPLGLLQLTCIIAFAKRKIIPQKYVIITQLALLFPFTIIYAFESNIHHTWIVLSIHLLTFFFSSLVCINELVSRRPQLNNLAEFYLWMSLGGFLGALFTALIAPKIFHHLTEYPIALAIACMMRPIRKTNQANKEKLYDILWPVGIFLIIFLFGTYAQTFNNGTVTISTILLIVSLILVIFSFLERTVRFGLGIAAILIASMFYLEPTSKNTIYLSRNFFGTTRIINDLSSQAHVMMQANTILGVQYLEEQPIFTSSSHMSLCSSDPKEQLVSLETFSKLYGSMVVTYFTPLQKIINILHETKINLHIGIAGLGAGGAACLANANDYLTFYENNPQIIKVAKDKRYFTYLSNCPPDEIILGDARSSISKTVDNSFDLIVLDAYNSNTIPTHLITRNAVALYLNKINEHGLIAFNLSNHSMNLIPVLSAITNSLNLYGILNIHEFAISKKFHYTSIWYVVARHEDDLDELAKSGGWGLPPPSYQTTLWTDAFSNVTQLIG